MFSFIIRRLITLIPTVFGISFVTFILINLAIDKAKQGDDQYRKTVLDISDQSELGRAYGLHLPLFINFDIQDIEKRTDSNILKLENPITREPTVRAIVKTGAAVLPYLLPRLANMQTDAQTAALNALDKIAEKINISSEVINSKDRLSFWLGYYDTFGSDFDPVRAKRLVRRYVEHNDQLALSQLKNLGTYALPQTMELLTDNMDEKKLQRVTDFLCFITDRNDFYVLGSSYKTKNDLVSRWQEWWEQRYDLYTSFEGFSNITGSVTQTRYFKWLSRVLTFHFGVSSRDGRPIRKIIMERMPVTLALTFSALILSYLIAVPIGVISAVKKGSLFDRLMSILMFIFVSLPTFWIAMILLRFFGNLGFLDWFPSQGIHSDFINDSSTFFTVLKDTAYHFILPVTSLSFVSIAMLARYQRIGMLRVTDQNFIRTARAKGLSETRIILVHALKNGIIPVITLMGLQLPYLVSSSIVIEKIFGIKGMGLETFEAIQAADYYWLTAVITVTAVLTLLGMLASDVVYALVDPRIMPGRKYGRTV